MKVVLAGGTGALGRRLLADLGAAGHEVVVLTRRADPAVAAHRQWDGRTVGPWEAELDGAAVVNLTGALVDRRPTAANIELLTRSRVEPTRALAEAAARCSAVPPVWVQMSTLAIYGDGGEAVLDESSPPADGPPQMAGVAKAWEAAAADVPAARRVILRTAVVLDRGTPAMKRLSGLVRWGLGGRMADGRQWISWLHIDDYLAIVRLALEADPAGPARFERPASPSEVERAHLAAGGAAAGGAAGRSTAPSAARSAAAGSRPAAASAAGGSAAAGAAGTPLDGVVHATAPNPVRNADVMATLRDLLHRPWAPPTPAALIHVGGLLLRTDPALALTGRRCVPARLLDGGFTFRYPELRPALADLLGPTPTPGP